MFDGVIVLKSVFYILTYSGLFISVLLYKKTEIEQNIIIWISLSIIIIMCLNSLAAVVFSLIGIPINVLSLSFSNILLAGLLAVRIIKHKEYQSYYFSIKDLIIVVFICIFSVVIGINRFSLNLDINYLTSDPSQHFQFALNILNSGKVSSMFFAALNNAVIIEILLPVFSEMGMVKSFIISDIMMFALSGLVFYSLIEEFLTKKTTYILAFFFTIFYLICYPLNNLIFGFVYLGIGVSLVGYIIFMSKITFLEDSSINERSIPLLALGTLGVILCYSLFAPIIYLSLASIFIYYYWKKRELLKRQTIFYFFLLFILPGLIGVYFSYFKIFTDGVTMQSGISMEGYIYRDVYSNFVLIIPIAIFVVFEQYKHKSIRVESILFFLLLCFMVFLFADGIIYSKVSSYYYFKNYYLLWLIVLYLVFQGLIKLGHENKPFFLSILIVWMGLFLLNQSQIEIKIQNRNLNFMPTAYAGSYFDLYNENMRQLKSDERRFDKDKMELYKYVRSFKEEKNIAIPISGYWEDVYWYEGLTDQRLKEYYEWNLENISFIDKIAVDKIEYIVVLNSSELYQSNPQYFEKLEIVFQNDAGTLFYLKKEE